MPSFGIEPIGVRYCKQCGEEMNPVQIMLSFTHGVCGKCCRKNHKLVIIGGRVPPE